MILASFPADDHLLLSHWRLSVHMIISHVILMAIWGVESSANKWISFPRCEAKSSRSFQVD